MKILLVCFVIGIVLEFSAARTQTTDVGDEQSKYYQYALTITENMLKQYKEQNGIKRRNCKKWCKKIKFFDQKLCRKACSRVFRRKARRNRNQGKKGKRIRSSQT